MTGSYVFDANAVLDFVEAGPGIHKVDQLLHAAARQQATALVSVMNLGEVFYWLWRKRSEVQARPHRRLPAADSDRSCGSCAGPRSWRTEGSP
jgi:hypothetical protein